MVASLKSVLSYTSGKPQHRNLDILPLVSALNLILQQHASRNGTKVGREGNKYFFPTERLPLHASSGLEAWRGFYASVRPTYNQLMVNVNACMTAFYTPGNLAQAIMHFGNQSHGGLPRGFVGKVRVRTQHLGHKKRLFDLDPTPADRKKFDCAEFGGMISVTQFFKKSEFVLPYVFRLP